MTGKKRIPRATVRVYEVLDGGVLSLKGSEYLSTRSAVFRISGTDLRSPSSLGDNAARCPPLAQFLLRLRIDLEGARVWSEMESAFGRSGEDEGEEDGVPRGWIHSNFGQVSSSVREWLKEEPDWASEGQYVVAPTVGVLAAADSLEGASTDVLQVLDIAIDYVRDPLDTGSYSVAKLHMDPKAANVAATNAGIAMRFESVDKFDPYCR